jgi:hypothetical protein
MHNGLTNSTLANIDDGDYGIKRKYSFSRHNIIKA